MRRNNFKQFMESNIRNEWIKEPGIDIYVRKTERFGHKTIDIANMQARKPGSGSLTKFLNKYEKKHIFYIENILNDRLVPFFEKRGYLFTSKNYPWCMISREPK